jgi:hypothetical protein
MSGGDRSGQKKQAEERSAGLSGTDQTTSHKLSNAA